MNTFNISNYLFVIKQINYKEHKKYTDDTNLGVLWNVLNPFLYMLIIATYYENVILHDIPKFPVFVFVGVIVFNYYKIGTFGAMKSLVNNKNLLIKTKVPLQVFIMQKVFAAFRDMLYGSVALIPIMIFFKVVPSIRIFEVIPVMVLSTIIIFSIGELLAILYVFFADVEYLYGILLSLLIFTSGVFIPIDHLPPALQNIMEYSPIFLSIYISRNAIIYNLPSHWTAWTKLLVWAIILLGVSYKVYEDNRDKCVNKL